jgi:CBS domain-containing membrane protein
MEENVAAAGGNKISIKRGYRKIRYVMYRETLIDKREHFFTFLGAFAGIALIGFLNAKILPPDINIFLIGSFGASAVLVYGLINSPLAQPRNLIGGHVISAITGVTVHLLIPDMVWLSSALAVASSIVLMQITQTLHPPGGATALIANIGNPKVTALGYWFVVTPVLSGVLILLLVALIFNNISSSRTYPVKKKSKYKKHHFGIFRKSERRQGSQNKRP